VLYTDKILYKYKVNTNTSGVNFTSRISLLVSLMSAWWEAEADLLELLSGLPGDRERDLDLLPLLPRLPRLREGELEVEPLFLCLKDVKGCKRRRWQRADHKSQYPETGSS
jgi:hypothetical protein